MPELYFFVSGDLGPKKIDTILSESQNSGNLNQRFLGKINTTFCKGTKCDIRPI